MSAIDKNIPWYWICSGESENAIGFNCVEATRSKLIANIIICKRNIISKDTVWYLKERFEHPDPDYKQYKCPECDNLMSSKELDDTWDWSGPHCNKCGCTGMSMFASVQAHAPVMSYKR